MEKKFTNFKGSEIYCRGYKYGMKCASEDIKQNKQRREPIKEATIYQVGVNNGYNDYYNSYEKPKALIKKQKN